MMSKHCYWQISWNIILAIKNSSFSVQRCSGNCWGVACQSISYGNPLYSSLRSSIHVSSVCKAFSVQPRDLRRLGQYLTLEATAMAANALVSNWLDYCNFFVEFFSDFNVRKCKSVEKSPARIVSNTTGYSQTTPALESLYWLPLD